MFPPEVSLETVAVPGGPGSPLAPRSPLGPGLPGGPCGPSVQGQSEDLCLWEWSLDEGGRGKSLGASSGSISALLLILFYKKPGLRKIKSIKCATRFS